MRDDSVAGYGILEKLRGARKTEKKKKKIIYEYLCKQECGKYTTDTVDVHRLIRKKIRRKKERKKKKTNKQTHIYIQKNNLKNIQHIHTYIYTKTHKTHACIYTYTHKHTNTRAHTCVQASKKKLKKIKYNIRFSILLFRIMCHWHEQSDLAGNVEIFATRNTDEYQHRAEHLFR